MGYYTHYQLEFNCFGESVRSCNHKNADSAKYCQECGKKIEQISLNDVIKDYLKNHVENGYDLIEILDTSSGDWKWYEHETYMKELSKKFQKVLFTLSGEGEESGDIWKEYYLGGKVQKEKAEIKIKPFDKNKLV